MMVDQIAQALSDHFDWLALPSAGSQKNLFKLAMPEAPDFAVALFMYPGESPVRTMGKPNAIVKPRIQVLVRALHVEDAFSRSYEIRNYLDANFTEVVIDGVRYHDIHSIGEPGPIGPDDNTRERVTTNYSVWKDAD